ncbi:MAG: FimB/Mfa2 family fimbrial subunit [Candidatus Symbiothrix sp.]|jgi:hypothetical protein|nr:FimB/Mfa2 family fimbrial subunit [Candidatus Symbiothrix sp.]
MRKNTNSWRSLLFLLIVSFAISSCNDIDNIVGPDFDRGKGEEQDFVFQVAVPEVNKVQLRSMTGPQENTIDSIDIFSFYLGTDNKQHYDYHVTGQLVESTTNPKQVKATVWTRTAAQYFVIITNAREEVKQLFSKEWKNAEKDAMLAELEFSLGTDHKWNAATDNYTAFPMWGESVPTFIDKIITTTPATTPQVGTIHLLRMVAKMDVELKGNATTKFNLTEVFLYNVNTNGRIVPSSSVVQEVNGKLKVSAPTLPDSPVLAGTNSDLVSYSLTPGTTNLSLKDEIYLFETKQPQADTLTKVASQATCLVIGGVYSTDAKPTYYRVDFLNADKDSLVDILRNHLYTVNITDVLGSGYDTPQEAFEAKGVNMLVDILEWDNSGMENVEFDGQYFLSVSRDEFIFSKEAYTQEGTQNVLEVLTDYKTTATTGVSGWYVEKIVDADGVLVDWLTLTPDYRKPDHGTPDLREKVVLTLTQNEGPERVANIIFAAGRLRYPVKVTQTDMEGARIKLFYAKDGVIPSEIDRTRPITQDTIVFDKDPQNLFVEWTPATSNLVSYLTLIPGTNPAKFTVGNTGIIAGNYSPLHMAISPEGDTGLSSGYVGYAKLMFTVSNGLNTDERSLVLKRVKN